MSTRYYDTAIVNKIKSWIPNESKLQILGPDETERLFNTVADITKDKPISLPLVALSRDDETRILSVNKKPLTFDGMMKESNGHTTLQINAIPISLSYQLDIYCRYFDEADEYVRNFVFNLINHPKIEVLLPYNNSNIIHNANIILEDTIKNNSAIPQRLIAGQFTRMTIRFIVDDAYLFSIPYVKNVNVKEGNIDVLKKR